MRRALELAGRGRGAVEPNPMVGCVIVKEGRAIGEGWHEHFGQAHAEPNALAACTESPQGATVFVNLEPCCHAHKKTPPCVPRLIAAQVDRVVVGCLDPNPAVAGRGVAQLREAGIAVTLSTLEAQCRQLNAPFFARQLLQRPYVTLKWAESADGKVGGPGGRRVQISNAHSMRVAHEQRSRCDAILIGIGTALNDDPMLTLRGIEPIRPLLRVVIDPSLRLPRSSRLAQTARERPTVVYCNLMKRDEAGEDRADALRQLDVEVTALPDDANGDIDLSILAADLVKRNVTHLLVEGGPKTHERFLRQRLADRAWVFHSPMRIDAADAPSAVQLVDSFLQVASVGLAGDRLVENLNTESNVYFAPEASVDIAVARASSP
jgi:diaminohydroxyphosphoribosylaminopyrimidine deaminase/5-amino-6-(5-phosphoribosylamino)uracil reductase